MSEAIEVYSCYPGQALKEGKLDYAHDIVSREQAAGDALARCQRDPRIHKIAYYRVDASGNFRSFYSYTNPNPTADAKPLRHHPAAAPAAGPHGKTAGRNGAAYHHRPLKPATKRSLKDRVLNFFMEDY